MDTRTYSVWQLRLVTLIAAALAAASAAYWALQWRTGTGLPSGAPAGMLAVAAPRTDTQSVARALGGGKVAAVAPSVSLGSRFVLAGVVAQSSRRGYALIAVDGKAARPYAVGSSVTEGWVLHSVAPRSAALAPSLDAPVSVTLNLPKLATP